MLQYNISGEFIHICLITSKTVGMNMKGLHMSQTVFRVSQQLMYNTFFTTRSKYTE